MTDTSWAPFCFLQSVSVGGCCVTVLGELYRPPQIFRGVQRHVPEVYTPQSSYWLSRMKIREYGGELSAVSSNFSLTILLRASLALRRTFTEPSKIVFPYNILKVYL